ncbi:MAG TPA: hypothetical protein ENI23_05710 [bacterium]|nr:hypothetical protein [bacterium]
MKKAIIIGTILILSGGTYVALQLDEVITPQEIINLDFSPVDFSFTTSNAKWATTTDVFENEIRTGINIPITYDFPIATTSGYIVKEIEEDIGMTLDGYNMCRFNGKTKIVCVQELNDDIEQTVNAFKENKARELNELKRQSYQDEIVL